MARVLTPVDAYALMNSLVAQATGQAATTQVNASNFVSVGEQVLATGYENTLNALSLVLGRTFVAVRPYNAKLKSIQAINTGEYSHRLRKISYYSRNNLPAGNFNTNLYPANLAMGKTNAQDTTSGSEATKSMWLQNPPVPLEMNFAGSSVWQTSTTVYRNQLKQAFRSEADFLQFVAGVMTEKGNDIESNKEAFNRLTILQEIGMIYDNGTQAQAVNLTAAFNAKFGTSYTSAQLRTTHLEDFLKFFVATFKLYSDRLTERSALFHDPMPKQVINPETGAQETLYILRHTPKERQKALLYNPLFVDAEAQVLPGIFNPEYLNIENFEAVDYWQSNYSDADRSAVNVIPAEPGSGGQVAGEAVELDYVVGLLYDTDAMMTDFQLDDADATPMEARKKYYNVWWDMARNAITDPTENAILFFMAD